MGRPVLGVEEMALRCSVMASSNWFLAQRALPRLSWAGAYLGSRSMALRNSAMASSNWFLLYITMPRLLWGLRELGIEVDGLAVFGHGLVQLVLGL